MRYPSVTRWSVWEQGRDLGEERAERRGRAWIVVGRVVRAGVEKVIVSKGRSRPRHNIAQRPSHHITSDPRSRPWPPLIVPLSKISDRHIPFDRYDRWSPPTFVTMLQLQRYNGPLRRKYSHTIGINVAGLGTHGAPVKRFIKPLPNRSNMEQIVGHPLNDRSPVKVLFFGNRFRNRK